MWRPEIKAYPYDALVALLAQVLMSSFDSDYGGKYINKFLSEWMCQFKKHIFALK